MDALCIKMIANTRKLKQPTNTNEITDQKPLSDPLHNMHQILEQYFLTHQVVQDNPVEFAEYLGKCSTWIISTFEQMMKGKAGAKI